MGPQDHNDIAFLMRELLGRVERLDERTKIIQDNMSDMKDDLKETSEKLGTEIEKLNNKISAEYVKKSEFTPIKQFTYGVISFILVSVGTAIFTLLKP